MLKQTLLIITLLSLYGVSYQSFAGSAGWSGQAKITSIYAMDDNRVIMKLSSFDNPGQCKTNSSGDIFINPNTQKTWFTLLLSAYMAGKTVNIYVRDHCTPYWAGTDFANIGHVVVTNE